MNNNHNNSSIGAGFSFFKTSNPQQPTTSNNNSRNHINTINNNNTLLTGIVQRPAVNFTGSRSNSIANINSIAIPTFSLDTIPYPFPDLAILFAKSPLIP